MLHGGVDYLASGAPVKRLALALQQMESSRGSGRQRRRRRENRSVFSGPDDLDARYTGCCIGWRSGRDRPLTKDGTLSVTRLTTCTDTSQGATIMSETLTMSRGQLHDLLARFAVENPKYREALINDPKMVLEKQLGHNLGKIAVKSVIETPDTMYVVVPYVAKEGELSDSDLENVAGGLLDNLNATCNISGGLNLLSSNVAIELG
jgi:hypothetical protein